MLKYQEKAKCRKFGRKNSKKRKTLRPASPRSAGGAGGVRKKRTGSAARTRVLQ